MTGTLDSLSLVGVYSAIAVYAIAFVLYTIDLSRRAATVPAEAKREAVAVGGGAPTAVALDDAPPATTRAPRYVVAAVALTILAWVIQIAATVLRGIAAGRVPWANMYEFALTSTSIIVAVFLGVQLWRDFRFVGAFLTGFVTLALGIATVSFYVPVIPLVPSLQSYWLVVHVFVASLATGFLGIGSALSVMQLLRSRRGGGLRLLRSVPDAETLERNAYRMMVIGFVFWSFTLMAGAIWAERAWGRYWGWDVKEVWTFVVWVIFAGYIHARATRGWRGTRSAWLGIVGFAALVFNFTVVNLYFKGLHAYSGF